MIDKKLNDVYQIRYYWEIKFKILNSTKVFYPTRLKSVQKINDYEKNFFPIFKMEMLINDRYFDLIFREQRNLRCKVKLYKKYFLPESIDSESADNRPVKEMKVMEEDFIVFFDKLPGDVIADEKIITKENMDQENDEKKSDQSIGGITSTEVTVTLWNINSLKSYKRYINELLVDADVGTALGYIINAYDEIKSAIIDIPDNTLKYQELILLPYGMRNSIYSLQYRYGIYANGLWSFFDMGRLYILKAFSINHQYEQGKAQVTKISLRKNPNSLVAPFVCGTNKKNQNFIYEATGILKKQNIDVIMGEVFGDSLVYTNFDKIVSSMIVKDGSLNTKSPLDLVKKAKLSHADSGAKLEMEYDSLNNPYNMIAKMRSEAMNIVLPITVNGVDLDSFTPEKIVNLEIADSSLANSGYGGEYCIRNVIYAFTTEKDGKLGGTKIAPQFETTAVARVLLSKVPKDSFSN